MELYSCVPSFLFGVVMVVIWCIMVVVRGV